MIPKALPTPVRPTHNRVKMLFLTRRLAVHNIAILWCFLFAALVSLRGDNLSVVAAAAAAAEPNDDDSTPYSVPEELLTEFQENGYILLRDVFDEGQIQAMQMAAEAITMAKQQQQQKQGNKPGGFFTVMETGVIFDKPNRTYTSDGNTDAYCSPETATTTNTCMDKHQILQAFRDVAIHSPLASISAQLMQLDRATQNVRILRDVFLAKPVQDHSQTCDWHVDDQGFWPESYLSSAATASGLDQYGINAWIALDDMPAKFGGSMIVAKGSHKADWRHEAYEAIGQNRTVDGGLSRDEVLQKLRESKSFFSTCDMPKNAPALREQIEATKVVFDLKKGDIILASRLLFHRTDAVTTDGLEYYGSLGQTTLPRYSIRYVPGTARLPQNEGFELSAVSNPQNGGKSLNDIVRDDHDLWYPRVWPTIEDNLDKGLASLAQEKLPTALEKLTEARAELSAAVQEYFANLQPKD